MLEKILFIYPTSIYGYRNHSDIHLDGFKFVNLDGR